MANKKKKFNIKKIIEVESVIAIVLISVGSWGFSEWYDFEASITKTRQMVFNQYLTSQNLILDNIDQCLHGKQVTENDKKIRLKNRENLVKLTIENARIIPPSAYFSISKFTRLDNAYSTENLCSLNKKEIEKFQKTIYSVEIMLWKELKLRPPS